MATATGVIVTEDQNFAVTAIPKHTERALLLNELTLGTILTRADAPLPEDLNISFNRWGKWKVPQGVDAFGFERSLAASGWNYFFIVPSIRIARWAFRPEGALRRAMKAALRVVEHRKFNSIEIVGIDIKKMLGVYRVRLTTHARHASDSPFVA